MAETSEDTHEQMSLFGSIDDIDETQGVENVETLTTPSQDSDLDGTGNGRTDPAPLAAGTPTLGVDDEPTGDRRDRPLDRSRPATPRRFDGTLDLDRDRTRRNRNNGDLDPARNTGPLARSRNTISTDRYDGAGEQQGRVADPGFRPDPARLAPTGLTQRVERNVAVVELLDQLRSSGRDITHADRHVLSGWTGWGAAPRLFEPGDETLASARKQLDEKFDDRAWAAAAHSTLNAHFTDPNITAAMWDLVTATGFESGRVLEPGCGSGNFIGTAPQAVREASEFVGIELEPITAAVAQALYPMADIRPVGFETVRDIDGSYDLAIGNVPFGKYSVFDPLHNPDRLSIHNHFLAKSLALTKPGGIVAAITSRYTLDARNPAPRRLLQSHGDLIAAIRLPSGAHQRLAGTAAVTDILVFRRRGPEETPAAFDWETTDAVHVVDGEVRTNFIFTSHGRGVVIGAFRSGRGMYGNDELLVDQPDGGWQTALQSAVDQLTHTVDGTFDPTPPRPQPPPPPDIAGHTLVAGELFIGDSGRVMAYRPSGPTAVPSKNRSLLRRLRSLVELRDTARSVMDLQSHGTSPGAVLAWEDARADLNDRYDNYVRIWGPINAFTLTSSGRRSMSSPQRFRKDPGWGLVSALEVFDDTSQTATKAAIFEQWLITPQRTHAGAETLPEALATSLATHRSVDIDFIAGLLASDAAHVLAELRQAGRIHLSPPNPEDDGDVWIDAQSYLSGNVRTKLRTAATAAETDDRYQINVEALKEIVPEWIPAEAISARLGAVWIDEDTVRQFLVDTLAAPAYVKVEHAALVGEWSVSAAWSARSAVAASTEWGTSEADAYRLVEDALNLRATILYREDSDGKRVKAIQETMAANDKRTEIEDRFADWVWEDPERAARLEAVFNERFNSTVLPTWDGTHLGELVGLSATFQPHKHQTDAVWRIMGTDSSTLLPHRVGAGKTAAMVIAGRQLKRTGQITKPLYVVPNHMLDQFSREFSQLYPTARVLVAGKDDLARDARRTFVARCATGDWDGVVMTQSTFSRIETSIETQTDFIRDQLTIFDEAAHRASEGDNRAAAKAIEKAKARLNSSLATLLNTETDLQSVTFEQLGVDYVFADEAHAYKGLPFFTKLPIGTSSSKRATDMCMKLDWLRSQYGPKVATFATGTPIANSLAEMWVMKRFLAPDTLDEMEMMSFDSWAGTFARSVTNMELAPEGGRFRLNTRIASFDNVPELLTIFRSFADFLPENALDSLNVPDLVDGQAETVLVPATDQLRNLIAELGERADDIRGRGVDPTVDNMLKVCNDGRLASLDLRLIDRTQPVDTGKVDHVAQRVTDLWQQYRSTEYLDTTGAPSTQSGALQAVFCDKGTPGSVREFTVYDELKRQLVQRGMDPERIAFVHDANSDTAKARLFTACRDGDIDVIVGSTDKMGVGTNIQNRLVALHHIDAPWRPADIEQREGRALRQGNQNPEVHIIRYVTEASFDPYMWQTLERKARFIGQVTRTGEIDPTMRSVDDLDTDVVLSYAELKAIATGNPLVQRHAEVASEHARLTRLAVNHAKTQRELPRRIASLQRQHTEATDRIERLTQIDSRRQSTRGNDFAYTDADGTVIGERADGGRRLRECLVALRGTHDWAPVGTLGGMQLTGRQRPSHLIPGFEVAIDATGFSPTGWNTAALWDAAPHTLMTTLERRIEKIPEEIDISKQRQATCEEQISRASELVGHIFPHTEQVDTLTAELEALSTELAGLDAPPHPPPPPSPEPPSIDL